MIASVLKQVRNEKKKKKKKNRKKNQTKNNAYLILQYTTCKFSG